MAASVAIWLDPVLGFSAIVISAVVGAATLLSGKTKLPCLKWSLIGSGLTLIEWWCDGSPWSPTAGELRYLHPYYAFAWVGLGLAVTGVHNFRSKRATKPGLFPYLKPVTQPDFPLLRTS